MRTTRPALARLLCLSTAAGLVLVGLLVAVPTSSYAADPLYGAPAVGSCHDATFNQAKGNNLTVPTVPCRSDHTLVTTRVVRLPANVDASDWDAVQKVIRCEVAEHRLLGRNPLRRALTMYAGFSFIPTADQRAAGARWASCHLTLWGTRGLYDLPTTLRKLPKRPPDALARCATLTRWMPCSEKHSRRAVAAFFVRARGGDKAVGERMSVQGPRICAKRLRIPGLSTYRRHTRSKVIVTCFKKTRS